MAYKIGLFALKKSVGVTATCIHIANFIAGSEKSIAIQEYKDSQDPIFSTARVEFNKDGTFVANKVHYYPAECEVEPDEDVIIIDFGEVNILFDFPEGVDRWYLCTEPGSASLNDVEDFLNGHRKVSPEVMVFTLSKVDLREFLDAGFKTIMVPDRKEERIDYNLAMQISMALRKARINPPEYHRDWEYDKVEFYYEPEPEKPEKKRLFGGRKKNKKTEEVVEEVIEEVVNNESIEDLGDSGVGVAVRRNSSESNELFELDFDGVPLPTAKSENNQEGVAEVADAITEEGCSEEIIEDVIPDEILEEKIAEEIFSEEMPDTQNDEEVKVPTRKEIVAKKKADKRQARIDARNARIQAKIDAKNAKTQAAKEAAQKKAEEIAARKQAKIDAEEAIREAARKKREEKIKADAEEKALAEAKAKAEMEAKAEKKRREMEKTERKRKARATKGIVGRLIKVADEQYDDIANIFIVTKSNRLFVFNNVSNFFKKLEPLLRELGENSKKISYIVITFAADKSQLVLSDKTEKELGNVYTLLESLDTDLRNAEFEDEDFRKHKELQLFAEVIHA